jgi:hypothetical protein
MLLYSPLTPMKRRSIAVVVAILFVVVAALWLLSDRTGHQPVGLPELVALAPLDAKTLIYLDLHSLRESAFLEDLARLLPASEQDADYRQFVAATGFDFERDLDRVLFLLPAPGGARGAVALADGRFDRTRITSYALRTGRRELIGEREYFVVPVESESRAVTLSFLAPGRILLAEGETLPAQTGGVSAEVREKVRRVSGSPLFALGALPTSAPPRSAGQIEKLFATIRWWSLAVRPEDSRLLVVADAECESEDDARQLAGAMDGLRALGRSVLAEKTVHQQLPPESAILVEALLQRGQVSQQQREVRFHFDVTREMLASLGTPGARR